MIRKRLYKGIGTVALLLFFFVLAGSQIEIRSTSYIQPQEEVAVLSNKMLDRGCTERSLVAGFITENEFARMRVMTFEEAVTAGYKRHDLCDEEDFRRPIRSISGLALQKWFGFSFIR